MFAACNRNDAGYDSRRDDPYCPPDSRYNSNEENPDWQITTKVKAALMSDSVLSASARFVSVTTNNGVVTLTGTVHSRDEARHIERKVQSVAGVRKVDNQLTISK